jgi:hypothetical protein
VCIYNTKPSTKCGVLIYWCARQAPSVQFSLPELAHTTQSKPIFLIRWPVAHYEPPKSLFFLGFLVETRVSVFCPTLIMMYLLLTMRIFLLI